MMFNYKVHTIKMSQLYYNKNVNTYFIPIYGI